MVISKRIRILTSAVLAAAMLLAYTLETKPVVHAEGEGASAMLDQAEAWAESISKQPGFESWKNASLEASALGPGTHGWLVLVKGGDGTVLGYLVVHALEAAEEGDERRVYRLGEYGLGRPPFDSSARDLALRRLELESLFKAGKLKQREMYVHPLLAAWSFNGKFADASSGESLPVDEAVWTKAAAEASLWKSILDEMPSLVAADIKRATSNPSFYPYNTLPWLTGHPLFFPDGSGAASIEARLDDGEPLRYTAERFDRALRQVWSVTGYHRWNGDLVFIALEADETEGSRRYVPLQLLHKLGSFYR